MVLIQKSRYKDFYKSNTNSSNNIIENNSSNYNKVIEIINIDHRSGNQNFRGAGYLCQLYKESSNNIKEYYYCGRGDYISELKRRIILKTGDKLIVNIECYTQNTAINSFTIAYNIIEEE